MNRRAVAPLTPGTRVLVTGAGITGRSVGAALEPTGVRLTICDDDPLALQRLITPATVVTTTEAVDHIADYALVVTSPGFPPTAPVLAAAVTADVPIWGDVELAWRLDQAGWFGTPKRWLVVTGTNGKTTTTTMLHAMLVAAGRHALLCGNIGNPVIDMLSEPAELLAVELSSFQLHWAPSLRPDAGVVLNVAEDHLDWHGSMDAYAADKARALHGKVAVAGVDDRWRPGCSITPPRTCVSGSRSVTRRRGSWGCATAPCSTGRSPTASSSPKRRRSRCRVRSGCSTRWQPRHWPAPSACPPDAISDALSSFHLGPHRAQKVADIDGVTYVDDSKATNPHAAHASIAAYPRVVWIAGGLLKGASVDELVADVSNRLVGVVLIGRDRGLVANALSRHAPDIPVVEVVTGEDSVVHDANESDVNSVTRLMTEVVAAARRLARQGDTVLLAPAGASFDQFSGYAERGDAFAAAVRAAR